MNKIPKIFVNRFPVIYERLEKIVVEDSEGIFNEVDFYWKYAPKEACSKMEYRINSPTRKAFEWCEENLGSGEYTKEIENG